LRAKFSKSGLVGLDDYEIVELVLTLGQPRKDCKPAAKEAIRRFKDLRGFWMPPVKNWKRYPVSDRQTASGFASSGNFQVNI